jgi:ADP-ribosyl-[dinitrogen reductase] hydrolase
MISQALAGKTKDEILFSGYDDKHSLSPKIQEIAQGRYREKSEDAISGSGYVVACLEAALWSFYHTANFRDAVLRAVNLGDDADTTGAVCGQIAGAFYGARAIPQEWLDILAKYDLIVELAEKLLTRGG